MVVDAIRTILGLLTLEDILEHSWSAKFTMNLTSSTNTLRRPKEPMGDALTLPGLRDLESQ